MNKEKVYLMIIDGFGEGEKYKGNAIDLAKTPNIDGLKKDFPSTLLKAAGNDVGLPEGTIGNSEVGHYTIGAGRIVYQSLEMINRSIQDKTFFTKPALLEAIKKAKASGALHLLGLISDEGVHAHTNHLFALLELAQHHNVNNIFIHAIADGRDVAERSAKKYISMIQNKIAELGLEGRASIATIIGRYYAMDRDNNWDRTEEAYNLYTHGIGTEESDPLTAIDNAYAAGAETDYYIRPIILDKGGLLHNQDSVIFYNFRTDRPRQLTQALTGESKIGFKPQKEVHPHLVCFGDYSDTAPIVFPPDEIKNNLSETLEKAGAKQLHIAETEKYAHVTYFFNSQIEDSFPHEKRIMIPSPKAESFDQVPAMAAREIAERAIQEIEKKENNFIVQNFANPDLVGHSGKLDATIQACEVIDECIERIADACLKNDYHLIITADHGNAEYMIYKENGEPCPSHTENPVPCILVSNKYKNVTLTSDRGLQDIAPTILTILDINQPQEMTGTSLLQKS